MVRHQPYNSAAVTFLKKLVEELVNKQYWTASLWNTSIKSRDSYKLLFHRVLIGDCTSFALPARYRDTYKGPGGMCSSAAIKLYYEYDLVSGSLSCLTDSGWARSDQTFNDADKVQAGDLILKDLGFYQLPYLRKIHQKGAYFISRLPARSRLYWQEKKTTLLALLQSIPDMKSIHEFNVNIGSVTKERTALGLVRLIIERVSPRVYEQKIRRVKKLCASKGKQPSKEQLLWNQYNIFITNVPPSLLSASQVKNTYRLGWQIQIVFKTWKSIFKMDKVKTMQLSRFQCLVWGTLLLILLFMPLLYFYKRFFWQKIGKEVSEWKIIVWLKEDLFLIYKACKKGNLITLARALFGQILLDGFKEKRKKHGAYTHLLPFEILTTP